MGDLNVRVVNTQKQLNGFTKCLLRDVYLLEQMLEEQWFDTEQMHIGAEQEICLIDKHGKPIGLAMEVLNDLNHPDFTTELAKFNLECNLLPKPFYGSCFKDLEEEVRDRLAKLDTICQQYDIDFLLTGILPTLRKFDLDIENITPLKRYEALGKAIMKLRGKEYELRLSGYDELNLKFDSVMLEACNTSFQVHLQVTPGDFVTKYNSSLFLAAPTMAVSSNSPLLFGKRLWHETRIALFEQSVDTRITSEHLRDRSPRVMFGNQWLKNSVVDLFKEDISRFRVMLMTTGTDECEQQFKKGKAPKLRALNIHNSTVYRWMRPCYGISPNGKPHLRIENRIIPSGPTVVDEIANSAYWLGAMNAFDDHYQNVTELIEFDQVKSNFYNAARNSLNAKFRWLDGKKYSIIDMIKQEFIPLAKEGLRMANVNQEDISKYIGIIEDRVEANQNGTYWTLNSFNKLMKESNKEEALLSISTSMESRMRSGLPVHLWKLADHEGIKRIHPSTILVEEFMTTDLFTVRKEDILEFVADMMDWQRIRFTPVEDDRGHLEGLVSSRMILRHFRKNIGRKEGETTVADIMIKDPVIIAPEQSIWEAMRMMKENRVSCLPVVKNDKLIGIVSEGDFLEITSTLIKILNTTSPSEHE
jgi:CBS domain-containing protein/gamma-glutamyl:cysteine ligase YbdK (ATP-grasp superfamily)